jgi:hypothetical protein
MHVVGYRRTVNRCLYCLNCASQMSYLAFLTHMSLHMLRECGALQLHICKLQCSHIAVVILLLPLLPLILYVNRSCVHFVMLITFCT